MNSPKVGVGNIILHPKENMVLLGLRIDPSGYGDGEWSLPGGHLEFGETFEDCAYREALEETGLKTSGISFIDIRNTVNLELSKHYITIYMSSSVEDLSTLKVMEPAKCKEWRWFDLFDLVSPMFLNSKSVIESNRLKILKGR